MSEARALFDFHLHTCWSYDATCAVERYFADAAKLGVTHIAITDHHQMDAFPEVAAAAKKYPQVNCIPGAELTAVCDIKPARLEWARGICGDKVDYFEDSHALITSGKVDAVVIDNEPAKAFVAANDGLKILETPYTIEDYAMAINKDNVALKDAINQALKELTDDGTIAAIVNKYIPAEG